MATVSRDPPLFQINTRVWLQRLSREAGRRITLADIDDATIDGFVEQGFDWIWLLSGRRLCPPKFSRVVDRAIVRRRFCWRALAPAPRRVVLAEALEIVRRRHPH